MYDPCMYIIPNDNNDNLIKKQRKKKIKGKQCYTITNKRRHLINERVSKTKKQI